VEEQGVTEQVETAAAVRVVRVEPSMWRLHRAVRLAMLLDTPLAFGSTFARELAFTDDQWQQRMLDSASWLAFDEGQPDLPVGAVTLYSFPEQDPGEACLVAMWVAPHARGRGVADALVTAVLDHAAATGLRRVTLDVADENPRAIGAYERLGFLRTGRTGTLPHYDHVTEFEMAREVDGRTAASQWTLSAHLTDLHRFMRECRHERYLRAAPG
jgi:ribosomal protein S18 acetylase RimI-like enzyme